MDRDNKGRFIKGHKSFAGIEKTQFRRGHKPWSYVDGRSRNPVKRPTIKGIPLAHVVWCRENLPYVPNGYVVHHMDWNPLNNNPDNLILMEDSMHRSWHNQAIKMLVGGK